MKSSEYWQRRFDELEAAQLRKAERYNAREVDRQFQMALAKIEKELSYWYQRLGENNSISANEARKLLAADELKEFHWNVEEYILRGKQSNYSDKWKKMLENASAKMHISRLDAMKLQIQQQIEVLYGNQVDGLDELIHNMYTEGFNKSAYTLDTGMGVHYNLATTDPRRIDAIINRPWADDGKTFSDRLWRDKDKLVNALQQEMTQAVTRGDKLGDAVKNISKRMGAAKSSAARLVMTESAFISGRAQRDCFKDLGVDKYEYVATLDRKTSETCRDLDGKVFEIDDYKPGTNAPPMHCWCRSCIAPYFDDMEMLGKRAARDPETGKTILVPENMTYREWEKKYEAPISGKQTERTDSNPISDEPVGNKVPSVDPAIDKLNGHTLEQRFFKSDYDAVQKLHAERLAEYEKAQEKASELDLEFIINATEESHKAALKASELRDKALKAMQETEAAIKAARSVYQAQIESKILGENLASGIKLSPEMDIDAMDTVYNVAKKLVKDYNLPMLPGVEYRPGFFKMLGSKAHATYDWNKKKIYLNETFANPAEYVQHRKFVEQQYKDRKASLKEVYENQLKSAEENLKNADDKGHKAMAQSSINYAKAELTQNRYAVAETIDDTLIHEYGHYLHDTLSYWENGFKLFGSKSMKSVKINNEYFWNNSLAGKVEAAKVSGYATENPLECFAESFNAFMKGKKLPDSLDKMMCEAFEKTGAKIPDNYLNTSILEITKEYSDKSTPRKGEIIIEEGYDHKSHNGEKAVAEWLYKTFGGKIKLLKESKERGVKTPDYRWNESLWELKSFSTDKTGTIERRIRKAYTQIVNGRGIILDFTDSPLTQDIVVNIVVKILAKRARGVSDVIIKKGNEYKVYRIKKE